MSGTTGASFPTNTNKKIESQNKTDNVVANTTRSQKTEKPKSIAIPGENVSYWSNVINNLKQLGKVMIYTNLINTNAKEINDLTLGIEFPNGLTAFGKTVLEKPENMQELVKQVSIEAGKEMRIKLIDLKASNIVQAKSDNGLSDLGIDINIIDN